MPSDGHSITVNADSLPPPLPWRWWLAIIDCIIISLTASVMVVSLSAGLPRQFVFALLPGIEPYQYEIGNYLLTWCFWPVVETWLLVKWISRKGAAHLLLPLQSFVVSPPKIVGFTLAAILMLFASDALFMHVLPEAAASDYEYFVYYMQSPMAPAMILLGAVIAPISEELMFRGFLQSVLARTWLKFWGATVVVSALWAGVHGYSWPNTFIVFVIGFILSFLLRKTGSLLPCMVVHGAANLASLLLLASGTE